MVPHYYFYFYREYIGERYLNEDYFVKALNVLRYINEKLEISF
jgi:hypothetical protein